MQENERGNTDKECRSPRRLRSPSSNIHERERELEHDLERLRAREAELRRERSQMSYTFKTHRARSRHRRLSPRAGDQLKRQRDDRSWSKDRSPLAQRRRQSDERGEASVRNRRLTLTSGVSLGAHLVCARVSGLSAKQRAMCRASPAAIAAVGDGLRMAYEECKVQLAGSRWNCSGVGEGNVFGHVMPLGTKEAAFIYALTSAGVTHALSTACAKGDLPGCGCRPSRRRPSSSSEQFQWGGCGETAYGVRFARRFLDARELEADARSLMNLHNNRVGRKIVKDLVRRECKCHGVSGSCSLKTCWRALPTFRVVAEELKEKYLKAKMVTQYPPPSTHAPQAHLVVRRSKQNLGFGRQPRKSELVFLEPSPSYCEPDSLTGALGTHGRHCNRTSRAEDGCESLCCGRGYNSIHSVVTSQCRCQFHWCCRVTCDTCVTQTELHVCK